MRKKILGTGTSKREIKRLRINTVSFALVLAMSMPMFANIAPVFAASGAVAADGITPAELDDMAIDPQSWKLQRDMTWDDLKKNPVIDWMDELNPDSLSNKFAHELNPDQNRKIIGGLFMYEYLDRKFISRGELGSDPLGYYLYNKDGSGMQDEVTKNPVINVPQLIADEKYSGDVSKVTDAEFAQWWADYLNKPQEINNFVGIDEFWREASYGKWATELRPYGPFTIPYFEFETMGYDMGSRFQSWDDVPPSFRNPSVDWQGKPSSSGAAFRFDDIAHARAVAEGVPFDDLDFFFLLHAGYDESGVWQEFGQAQFATRADIPYELGPGPRMKQVEEFFTEETKINGTGMLELYAERYGNNTAFKDELEEYSALAAAAASAKGLFAVNIASFNLDNWEFKLSQEDWDWVNGYNSITTKNTRYVDFTSWEAAVGEWSHAGSYTYNGRRIPRSTQGENDGMSTFAHEFGHISSIADNYGNPWADTASAATEPWELMSRGSFAGPFGDHARWTVPGIEAGSVPTHLMQYNKDEKLNYFDEGDILELSVEELAGKTPVVADIVSRNIPLSGRFYPGLADYGLVSPNYYKGIKLNFGNNEYKVANVKKADPSSDIEVDEEWKDKATIIPTGFTWTRKPADAVTIEVVDQSGYDSFTNDYGVLITRTGLRNTTLTGNNPGNVSNPSHAIIDSHLGDIAMIDFNLNGKYEPYPLAHATQLADATFRAGVSFTDTGYYATAYGAKTGNNPADWEVIKPGSIVRGEAQDDRDIVSGNTVNEFYDEANGLRFYILQNNWNPGKSGREFLSYQVGVLHDKGKPAGGALELTFGEFTGAIDGNYAEQKFTLKNTGEADIVRITLEGDLAEGYLDNKFYSEKNAVLLNNLFAVGKGEEIEFSVFVKADGASLNKFPYDDLTVKASSESDQGKETNSATELNLSTDAHLVEKGDSFSVYPYFNHKVDSNTAILEFEYDSAKFSFQEFKPESGVSLLREEKDGVLRFTVMVDGYNTLKYGEFVFVAKEDADLQNEDHEIKLNAKYVVKLEDGTKAILTATASTIFSSTHGKDPFPEPPGEYTLITLSNIIDRFGAKVGDEDWQSTIRFFDFNNNGVIDIQDIATVALKIKS